MQMVAMTEVEGHAAPLTSAASNNNATLDAGKEKKKTKKNLLLFIFMAVSRPTNTTWGCKTAEL